MEPVLFNIFTSDIDSGTECILSKSVDNIKLSGAVGLIEGRGTIWRNLDRLEEWACANPMRVLARSCTWTGAIPSTDTGWE